MVQIFNIFVTFKIFLHLLLYPSEVISGVFSPFSFAYWLFNISAHACAQLIFCSDSAVHTNVLKLQFLGHFSSYLNIEMPISPFIDKINIMLLIFLVSTQEIIWYTLNFDPLIFFCLESLDLQI